MNRCASKYAQVDLSTTLREEFFPDNFNGYVYVILAGGSGHRKIGVAKNPSSRLCELQVGSPLRLKIDALFGIVGVPPIRVERTAHKVASGLGSRLNGEWFDIGLSEAISSIELAASAVGAEIHSVGDLRKSSDEKFEVYSKQWEVDYQRDRRNDIRQRLGMELT